MNKTTKLICIFVLIISGMACSVYAENLAVSLVSSFADKADFSFSLGGGGY